MYPNKSAPNTILLPVKKLHSQRHRAILGQLENVVKNIYPEGGTFAGMLGHIPFLLKDN